MGGFFSRPSAPAAPEPVKAKPVEVKPITATKDAGPYAKEKRRGRRDTILTSVTGVEDKPELSLKTLLGG